MTPLVALLLLQQAPPAPRALMQAYWDKLGMADKLSARVEQSGGPVPSSFGQIWLEKPGRMRFFTDKFDKRVDGGQEWMIDPKAKTYTLTGPEQFWCPMMLEPFFNYHTFNQPSMGTWADTDHLVDGKPTQVSVLILRSSDPLWTNSEVYVDAKTALPLFVETHGKQSTYRTRILELNLDPKWKFDWPSLDGYKKINPN
ncbi:MAG TPA: hypothetical protein VHE55_02395 [Fimbriimonadaceae bacterium]|nr:hypothetical protein [Fimbriimonadaceae bacterium]